MCKGAKGYYAMEEVHNFSLSIFTRNFCLGKLNIEQNPSLLAAVQGRKIEAQWIWVISCVHPKIKQ